MKLRWSNLAIHEFEDATERLAKQDPAAAQRIAQRIHEAALRLCEFPYIGHLADDDGARHWLVRHTPFILVYEIHGDAIIVSRVFHTRRDPDALNDDASTPAA